MSTLNEAVYSALSGDSALGALIGARAYPDVAPFSVAKPYVVWEEISNVPVADLDGSGGSRLAFFRVQISAYGADPDVASSVMKAVRAAMTSAGGFHCVVVEPGERSTGQDPDAHVYGRQCDFSVSFTPS